MKKYNKLLLDISNKIKNNIKDINKYETRLKNTKNNLEKESYKLIIVSLKNETNFLEQLIKEDNQNEQGTGNTKSV